MYKIAAITCLTLMSLICSLIWIFSENVIGFYTQEPDVIKIADPCLKIYLIINLIEVFEGNLSGCIRGIGL